VPGLWRRIFGRLDWQPPGWVPTLAARVRAEPRKYFGGLAALLVVAALGYWRAEGEADPGLTTEIALVLALLVGALAVA